MKIRNIFGNIYRGALGKAMVGSKWHSVDYIRKYVVPTNPRTALQTYQRNVMAQAVGTWQKLTPEQKKAYNRIAGGTGISGFNEFVRRLVFLIRQNIKYTLPLEGDTEVVDKAGKAIEMASVIVIKEKKVIYTGLTDKSGLCHYALTIEDAPYDVIVRALGFTDYQAEAQQPDEILTKITLSP